MIINCTCSNVTLVVVVIIVTITFQSTNAFLSSVQIGLPIMSNVRKSINTKYNKMTTCKHNMYSINIGLMDQMTFTTPESRVRHQNEAPKGKYENNRGNSIVGDEQSTTTSLDKKPIIILKKMHSRRNLSFDSDTCCAKPDTSETTTTLIKVSTMDETIPKTVKTLCFKDLENEIESMSAVKASTKAELWADETNDLYDDIYDIEMEYLLEEARIEKEAYQQEHEAELELQAFLDEIVEDEDEIRA